MSKAFDGADLVIVENVCSLPLNPTTFVRVAEALRGRSAILHHHDLAIERPELSHFGPPPNDDAWLHVCVSRHAQGLLKEVGIAADLCYNSFEALPRAAERAQLRAKLDVGHDEILVLQPTRAIARKAVPVGLGLAQSLGGTYWLTGDAEDGYENTLHEVFQRARGRVIHRSVEECGFAIADAYAACDLVVLPSTWEGFGNPAIESTLSFRPLSIGDYPVADELASLGFTWHRARDQQGLGAFLRAFDKPVASRNAAIAREHFSLDELPGRLGKLVDRAIAKSRKAHA
jgi:glycosyltransferase involved in cell wall biosynthesis